MVEQCPLQSSVRNCALYSVAGLTVLTDDMMIDDINWLTNSFREDPTHFHLFFVYFSAYSESTLEDLTISPCRLYEGHLLRQKKLTRNIEYLEWGPYISGHKWMLNTVVIPFSGTTTMLVKRLLIDKTITTSGTFPKPVLFFPVILHLTQ